MKRFAFFLMPQVLMPQVYVTHKKTGQLVATPFLFSSMCFHTPIFLQPKAL